jgi:hypothetical protein
MPNRSQKRRAKAINKRLGRDKTIKNTNKNRGKGTTKTNLGQGVSKCWNGVCERVDDIVNRDSGKKRKTKIPSSRKETTIDKDPSGKRDGISFPNFSLNKLNIGVGTLKGIGGSLKGRKGRRTDEFLNTDSEYQYYEDQSGNTMT